MVDDDVKVLVRPQKSFANETSKCGLESGEWGVVTQPRIRGLDVLRMLGVVYIVLADSSKMTGIKALDDFLGQGSQWMMGFFIMSGFILAYNYKDNMDKMSTDSFYWKRFLRLYPVYALTIIAACFVNPDLFSKTMRFFKGTRLEFHMPQVHWMLTCLNATTMEDNDFNTPAWCLGYFFIFYAITPTILRAVKTTYTTQTSRHVGLIVLVIFAMGIYISISANLVAVLAPHSLLFYYLAGITLGLMFSDGQALFGPMSTLNYIGTTVFFVAFPLTAIFGGIESVAFPLFLVLIWTVAKGEDPLAKALTWKPLFLLSRLSYHIFIWQQFAREISRTLSESLGIAKYWLVLPTVLLTISVLSFLLQHYVFDGMRKLVDTRRAEQQIQGPGEGALVEDESTCTRVLKRILYVPIYFGFVYSVVAMVLYWQKYSLHELIEGISQADGGFHSVHDVIIFIFVIMSMPAYLCACVGHLLWNPFIREPNPKLDEMVASGEFRGNKLLFRFVTRGKYPNLVIDNVAEALRILRGVAGLPADYWQVEVLTDNVTGVVEHFDGDANVTEIVVPDDYRIYDETGSETKYKARALNYAAETCGAGDYDWVIHLDEETRFDQRTVLFALKHAIEENKLVRNGEVQYGGIGQGVILYGKGRVGPIQNYMTTLADSARVSDDYGKFQPQYKIFERPLIGMHGSYIFIPHALEHHLLFNHGHPSSITEDGHFALMAADKCDVKFKWIDAFMYEQSPFSVKDFIMQRRRWFGGLRLVMKDARISLSHRVFLCINVSLWACSFFGCTACMILVYFFPMRTPGPAVVAAICLSAPCALMTYVLGFVVTYRVSDGIIRYIVLLILQVLGIPLFGMMEALGVAWSILAPPGDGFYIVQKESEIDGRKDRMNATNSEIQSLLNKGKATDMCDA